MSVVILNYRSKGLVKYCVRGFLKMGFSFPHEVIVVDNASNDGCCRMVEELYPSVRTITLDANRGYAAGNNEGIRASAGEYVLIANPDIVVRPGAVEELMRWMDANPRVAIVGPQLQNPDGSVQDSCYRFPTFWMPLYRRTALGTLSFFRRLVHHYRMDEFDHGTSRPVDWLLGACLLVRKSALQTVGLMDEQYFLYFEDVDWCRRFWNTGHEVWYHPAARMVHLHQRMSAEQIGLRSLSSRHTRVHIASWLKYMWKWRKKI